MQIWMRRNLCTHKSVMHAAKHKNGQSLIDWMWANVLVMKTRPSFFVKGHCITHKTRANKRNIKNAQDQRKLKDSKSNVEIYLFWMWNFEYCRICGLICINEIQNQAMSFLFKKERLSYGSVSTFNRTNEADPSYKRNEILCKYWIE